jgi:hypothetical protein
LNLRALGVSSLLPGGDLGDDELSIVDAAVEASAAQDTDFDLGHV